MRVLSFILALLLMGFSVFSFVRYSQKELVDHGDSVRFDDELMMQALPGLEEDLRQEYLAVFKDSETVHKDKLRDLLREDDDATIDDMLETPMAYDEGPYYVVDNDMKTVYQYGIDKESGELVKSTMKGYGYLLVNCLYGAEALFEEAGYQDITILDRYIQFDMPKSDGYIEVFYITNQGNFVMMDTSVSQSGMSWSSPFYLMPEDLFIRLMKEWNKGQFILGGWGTLDSYESTLNITAEDYAVDPYSLELSLEDIRAVSTDLIRERNPVWLYLGIGATVLCLGALTVFALSFRNKKEA